MAVRKAPGLLLMVLALTISSVVGVAAPLAFTAPVTPGGPAVLVPPSVVPYDPGTFLAELMSPYSFTTTAGTTKGTLGTAVYRNPTGTLDFYYQITNDAVSATSIARETNTNFSGFVTQVGFLLFGSTLPGQTVFTSDGTDAPQTADSSLVPPGAVIGFTFYPPDPVTNKVDPGEISAVFLISTNAINFTRGNSAIIDGGTQTVAAFQPSAVPEPGTLALMGLGLIGLAAVRRRKA